MRQIIRLNSANPLQINWLHEIVIIVRGCLLSMMILICNINIAEIILTLTLFAALVEPLISFIKLFLNKNIIYKLLKIIKAEQLQDFSCFKNHYYPCNGVMIDVFENKKMYRLDFHANGITHSDRVYHLDDRITEAFQSMIINKQRHSWGMSYFVKK